MLAVKGIYQNGQIILAEKVPFTEAVTVIVTFIEEPKKPISSTIDLTQFSFVQTRKF